MSSHLEKATFDMDFYHDLLALWGKIYRFIDSLYIMKFLRSFVFYIALVIWGAAMYCLFSPNPFFWVEQTIDVPGCGAHFTMFSGLAFITYVAQRQPKILRTILVVSLFGFLSEVIQYFEPVRTFEWLDVGEDVLGSIAGTLVGFVAYNIFRKLLTLYRHYKNKIKPPIVSPVAPAVKYPKIG